MRLLAALLALSGCAWLGPRPGPTKAGFAFGVEASGPAEARRRAVEEALSLYGGGGPAAAALLERPERLCGRERGGRGRRVVEVRLGELAKALEASGGLLPEGFPSGPARVRVLLREDELRPGPPGLGGGPADALRLALRARGVAALDESEEGGGARGAPPSPGEFRLEGLAASAAAPDEASGLWRARARLEARLTGSASRGGPFSEEVASSAEALDVSSAAARARALEQAGERAAEGVSRAVARARAGRAELILEVRGGGGLQTLRELLAALRRIDGVRAAFPAGGLSGEEGVPLRVFCEGLSADELGARLLRAVPGITVVGIQPELGIVTVEAGEAP